MPAQVAEERKTGSSDQMSPSPAKGKTLQQWLMGGIVLVVVVVPAVVTYLLLPYPTAPDTSHKPAAGEAHRAGIAEVSLGEFSISNRTAEPGTTFQVEFKLVAVTAAPQAQNLEAQVKIYTARIRQAVNTIVTQSKLEEITDPALETIQRLIREEVNRLLRKSYVNDVMITDITLNEQ